VNLITSASVVTAIAAVALAALTAWATRATLAQGAAQRLDARAPTVLVDLQTPTWPPYEPSVSYGGSPQPLLGAAATFQIPRQVNRRVLLVVHARLTNVGVTPAAVLLGDGGRFLDLAPDHPDALKVPPLGTDTAAARFRRLTVGESANTIFTDERTAGDWVEHARATAQGKTACRTVKVEVTDLFDAGVTDTVLVTLNARPLRPDEQDDGRWDVRDPHMTEGLRGVVEATAGPIHRTYWRSRAREKKLTGLRPRQEPPTTSAKSWHRGKGRNDRHIRT